MNRIYWPADEEFIRDEVPMTKFAVRNLILSRMGVTSGGIFGDVGAGSGSVAVQAALLGAEVYAIERELKGCQLITANAQKFGIDIKLTCGAAPSELTVWPHLDWCFIGGSGGNLAAIITCCLDKLKDNGVLGATFIKPENFVEAQRLMEAAGLITDGGMLQHSSLKKGLLIAQNPIFWLTGRK